MSLHDRNTEHPQMYWIFHRVRQSTDGHRYLTVTRRLQTLLAGMKLRGDGMGCLTASGITGDDVSTDVRKMHIVMRGDAPLGPIDDGYIADEALHSSSSCPGLLFLTDETRCPMKGPIMPWQSKAAPRTEPSPSGWWAATATRKACVLPHSSHGSRVPESIPLSAVVVPGPRADLELAMLKGCSCGPVFDDY
ncbi:predicted protein [Plenodomus lingam JN3]|uniref:Predicted protein n=1 Tax=Leptosphaeria maculans (strain JN3 / isolate v23.1.3 / race Av1-4-5-6-7-8) TaxID=985895 RepID=E4ZXI9_LEPMJ|nr:predicted protein [Plenodomus lingam JN3]CBX95399.1 predicted protein [Plenodomus lingam JN3]